MPDVDSTPIVDTDSLSEMFGPGTTVLHAEEDSYNIPEDVAEVLEAHGLKSGKKYQCMLKSCPGDTAPSHGSYIKSWRNSIPTVDWIANNYGPGRYALLFLFQGQNEEGKTRNFTETVVLEISEKYGPAYRKYQLEQRLRDMKDTQEKIRESKLDAAMETTFDPIAMIEGPNKQAPAADPKAYVREVLSFAKDMGLSQSRGVDWEKIMSIAMPMLPLLIKYMDDKAERQREQSERFMQLMLSATQSNSRAIVDLANRQAGPSSGTAMMEEMSKMLMSALDIKDALSGDRKETALDKVGNLIDKFAPMIISLAAMPRAARAPMVGPAKVALEANPDFQTVMNDPRQRVAMIRRLDDVYGYEQTDQILSVADIPRPAECPRDPEKRLPQSERKAQFAPGDEEADHYSAHDGQEEMSG